MQEREEEIRDATFHTKGEKIQGVIIDNEHYWPGMGRVPNHDKIVIVYGSEQKEEKN